MVLRRLGNKSKIAKEIQVHFPTHKIYIEPFFGAGGMFFNKPKVEYNFLNDIDMDVYNLYSVIISQKEELIKQMEMLPIHEKIFNDFKKTDFQDPVKKAVKFLFLSNFSYMGTGDILHIDVVNTKEILIKNIEKTFNKISDCYFTCCDFREMFKKITKRTFNENTFIYADPPYLGTENNYSHSFKESDSFDLFEILQNSGVKFAISEFKHPFIISEANKRNLNIIEICERQSLKNRNTEILITNYKNQTLF